MMGDGTTWNM